MLLLLAAAFFPPSPFIPADGDGETARAVITDQHGNPLPESMPLGEMVIFSFRKSVYGGKPQSLIAIITPPERAARAQFSDDGLTAYVPTGLKPVEISCMLIVAKGDVPDWVKISVKCGEGPIPPPDPPKPDPKPPTPEPAKSFRAIFVYDTSKTLTAAQSAVKDSLDVRVYLNDKTTKVGNVAGWRSWGHNTDATNDPTMKPLWDAAKPQITTVPCLVIEVNGKVDILPWPANAAECLATLKKYGGA